MLARSRNLRSLFRLCKRRLAAQSDVPPPPKTELGASQAAETSNEAATRGSGVGTLLAGAVVVLTGIAVYQNRHLFHEYPVHPVILKPQDLPQTLPSQQPMALDTPFVEKTVHKEESPSEKAVIVEQPPAKETSSYSTEEGTLKADVPQEEPKKEEPKKDVIPPQIIDNRALVELFSEALGDRAVEQGSPMPHPSEIMTDQDIQQLLATDLNPSVLSGKLLSAALKESVATKPDWPDFTARHEQATYDAEMLKLLIDKDRESNKTTVTELEDKLKDSEAQIQHLNSTVTLTKEEMKRSIHVALQEAEEKHQQHVKQLKEKLALEAAQATLQETTARHKLIDQLRERVNVLATALSYWTDQRQSSKEAQQLALEVASLDRLLDVQNEGMKWLRAMQPADVKDPVIKAALQCLPEEIIPSKRQLMQRFSKVRRHVESFSLLPPSGGGLLAQMTATLGARLKIHVPEAYSDGDDVTSRLDRVERALTDGSISHAVALLRSLTQDSGAADLSASWMKDAERYASLQAIRKILVARAQELTAAASSL